MSGNHQMETHYVNSGYPYASADNYMNFFGDASHAHAHAHAPVNYVYPGQMHNQENVYWSMHMNPYRYEFSDPGSNSYYGYGVNNHLPSMQVNNHLPSMQGNNHLPSMQGNNHLPSAQVNNHLPSSEVNNHIPSTEVNQRAWEYPSLTHVEEPTNNDMPYEDNADNADSSSEDSAEECISNHDESDSEVAEGWPENIDPDNMTYEELLDLGEAVGTESRGLSQELIKSLPTSWYKSSSFFSRKKSKERCVICLVTYKMGDQQITLPCKHVYHKKCGSKWLSINKTCPVCNREVYGNEAKQRQQ